jgi:hypothetical protein
MESAKEIWLQHKNFFTTRAVLVSCNCVLFDLACIPSHIVNQVYANLLRTEADTLRDDAMCVLINAVNNMSHRTVDVPTILDFLQKKSDEIMIAYSHCLLVPYNFDSIGLHLAKILKMLECCEHFKFSLLDAIAIFPDHISAGFKVNDYYLSCVEDLSNTVAAIIARKS